MPHLPIKAIICTFAITNKNEMKKTILFALLACSLTACHESLEDRAAREAREYTEKYCPTPYVNNTRTDSVAFDTASKTYTYYCSLNGQADSKQFIEQYRKRIDRKSTRLNSS